MRNIGKYWATISLFLIYYVIYFHPPYFPLHSHTSLTIWVSLASSRTLQHLGGCEPPPLWLMANLLYRLSGCRACIFVYNSTFISSFVSWALLLFRVILHWSAGSLAVVQDLKTIRDRTLPSLSFLFFFISGSCPGTPGPHANFHMFMRGRRSNTLLQRNPWKVWPCCAYLNPVIRCNKRRKWRPREEGVLRVFARDWHS